MSEAPLTSAGRVRAHRARKQLGVKRIVIDVSEQQVDCLANEGYLDGDNTVAQALEAFLVDYLYATKDPHPSCPDAH